MTYVRRECLFLYTRKCWLCSKYIEYEFSLLGHYTHLQQYKVYFLGEVSVALP